MSARACVFVCVRVSVCACICLRVNDQEWLREMSVLYFLRCGLRRCATSPCRRCGHGGGFFAGMVDKTGSIFVRRGVENDILHVFFSFLK